MNVWVLIYRIGWIALAVLIIIGVGSMFWPQIRQHQELQKREAALAEDIRLEEEMIKHLREQQERLRSDPRFVEKIAREELGYAKPDETIFKFVDDEPQTSRRNPP